jgi:predicted small metal-binding protein
LATTSRKYLDCSKFPNGAGCTLLISGSKKEVFNTALRHAIEEHGHKDTAELRKQLKAMIRKTTNKNQLIRKDTTQ